MIRKAETIAMTLLLVALYCNSGLAQAPPTTILRIDLENFVVYNDDTSDPYKFATDPNATTSAVLPGTFHPGVFIGDIVAVNGQPAKGTFTGIRRGVTSSTTRSPGLAIADTVRSGVNANTFEILKSDGSPIGTIVTYGVGSGSPPPGAPLAVTTSNYAIVGGTGAFLGARGQLGGAMTPSTTALRQASITEDPANRRTNGGGKQRFVLQVIPMSAPQIVTTPGGPAVSHSNDFALVTASRPAAPGEILSLFVTGLGPTRPGVDPGKPFPTSPLAAVNSPVEVLVNGKSAEVTAAVGFPGTVDGYQVNFRVPSETARGTATIQVTAAWIAGSEVRIPVQ